MKLTQIAGHVSAHLLMAGLTLTYALADSDDDDPLFGRTEEQITALTANLEEVIETAAFYAATSVLLVVLIVWAIVQRRILWAFYSFVILVSLWWIAFHEQNLSGLYWFSPHVPATVVAQIGFLISSINAVVAAVAARQSGKARLSSLLLLVALSVLPLWIYSIQFNDQDRMLMSIALFGASALCHLVPFVGKRTTRERTSISPVSIVLLMVTIVGTVFILGEFNEELDLVFLNRMFATILTAGFILLFLYRTNAMLRERDLAVQQSLDDAHREAEISIALLKIEQKYSRARELANERSQRLATASHDIRQPIAALRTTMDAITHTAGSEVKDQMKTAFDYLDNLASAYIQEAQDEERTDPAAQERLDPTETISTALISKTIERMFQAEAEQKGLTFSMDVEDAHLNADPLKLMRVMSNLTSNAINHTPEGYVAISGRPGERSYRFEVNNSRSMPNRAAPVDFLEPYKKGETSGGTGLGLSIVKEVTDEEGFGFEIDTGVGGQTSMRITIPVSG